MIQSDRSKASVLSCENIIPAMDSFDSKLSNRYKYVACEATSSFARIEDKLSWFSAEKLSLTNE